jgi:ribokinase
MSKILVVGSMNMDIVTQVDRHPVPGETIHGKRTSFHSGGKGANQAVAAARSGAAVSMAGALGIDPFGNEIRRRLSEDGINLQYVLDKPATTGVAIIMIDSMGENNIVLSTGANGLFSEADLEGLEFSAYDAILLQNEISWETNRRVLEKAALAGTRVLFNPAPALWIEQRYLPMIGMLILNEVEAEELTGLKVDKQESVQQACEILIKQGVKEVIVTLGSRGCFYRNDSGKSIATGAYKISAVDTTAAGDTFIGAFAAKYLSDERIEDSLRYATAAAALTISSEGAQSSIPTENQVLTFMSKAEKASEH